MSNTLLNVTDPVFDELRKKYATASDFHDIKWAAICPTQNSIFLTIREWNVTSADYESTFANNEMNRGWTKQSFNAFITGQLATTHNYTVNEASFKEGIQSLNKLHQHFVNHGATSFDCEVNISKQAVKCRISFIKESDWVSQIIYSLEFVWYFDKLTAWDSIIPTVTAVPFKLLETDLYGRLTKVSFLNPTTLEIYQTRTYNWKPEVNGAKLHAVCPPVADLDMIFVTQTTVGNGGVRCTYLGKYNGQLVEVTDHIRGTAGDA